MKRMLKKSLALILALTMVFGAAPLAGLVGLEWSSLRNVFADKAEAISQNNVFNENFCKYGNYYFSVENGTLFRYSLDLSQKEEFMSTHSFNTLSVYKNILYAGGSLDKSSYEIISYNDSSKKKDVVYKTGNSLESLYFYNNMLFFYDNGVVCSVDLGTQETNYIFDCNSKYYSCPLYFYNNELFFNSANTFYCYKLYSGDVTALCDGRIIDLIENELYYEKSDDDNGILKVGQINLSTNQNTIFFTTNYDKSSSSLMKPNVYDLKIYNNKIYFTVGHLEGTGGYYYGDLYYSNKGSSDSVLIKEETGSELYCYNNDLFITLGSDNYSGIYGLAKIENDKMIVINDCLLFIDDCYSGRVVNHTDGGLSVYDIKTDSNFKIADDEMYINRYEDKVNETIARYLNEYGIIITKEHFGVYYEILGYSDGILAFNPCLVIPNGMVFNRGERIFTGDTEVLDIRYLNHSDIFREKSYIADIWLNKHDYYDETIESKAIDTILNLDSISSDIYLQLSNDTKFKTALAGWNGLKIAFDGVKALEDGLSKDEIYETLIFDLLRKVMLENEEETGNIILDAVSATGNVEDNVTKYKKAIDNFVKVPGATTESLLDILKEWKFDPKSDSFTKFYATLNDTNDFSKKWSDSKFVKGVGAVAEIADSVSDFYKRFTGYCLAMDMSDEMVVMLKEMKNNTTNLSFKIALQNIINAFDNADYVAMVCTMELAEDGTYKVMDKLFDEVTKASPTYTALRKFYEAGVAFVNLVGNTSGIIDSYYLCEATFNFVKANKASITSLANNYKLSNLEIDAGAYVYAMRTYEQVYTIDLETTVKFVKSASEEGLINLSKKLGRTIMNFLTGSDIQSSYESVVESKDSILKSLNQMFWELDNTWKFNQDYLKRDYPEIYAVYVKNELIKEEYAPIINEAYISQSGESNIEWSFPYVFYAKNSNGEKTAYALYGLGAVDGVKLTEQIGSYRHSKEWLLSDADSPLTIYDEDHFEKFNKKYFLSTYSETISGNVYTNETAVEIGNPIKKVELGIPTIRNWLGSGSIHTGSMAIAIKDLTHSRYDVVYKIYRKAENSSWRLIDTINRATVSNSYITIYEDSTAVLGEVYSYKVSSFVNFGNGITLTSEMSDEFLASKKEDAFDKRKVDTRLINPRQSVYPISRISTQAVSIENSPYIELSWDKFGNADFYDIYRISSFGSKYNLIATVDGNNCSYLDYGVDNGVTYEYVVLPFETNEKGEKIYDVTKSAEGSAEFDLGEVYSTTWIIDGRTTIKEYLEGENINIPETLEKDGYEFVCWSPAVPATMPAYDLTFTAVFEKNTPPTEDELSISIRTPSTASIDYGDSIILHLDIDRPLPDGAYIEWSESNGNFDMSVSADGTTCKISPKSNGKTVFTVTAYDKYGDLIGSDTQEMTAKAGLWQKIVAFFKKIFGLTKTIPELFKVIF